MRVGTNIRKALATVDRIGPCTSGEVCPHMLGVKRSNAGKYLRRAVGLGLMTIDRTTTPHTFTAVDGWRDRVGSTKRLSSPAPKPIRAHQPCALQSVWGAAPQPNH